MIIDFSAIKKCIWITWLRFNKHWFNHNCLASPFSVCMIFDVCDGRWTKFLENFAKGFEGLSRSLVFTSQSSQQDWDCGSQSLSWHSLGEFGRGTAHQTPQGPESKNCTIITCKILVLHDMSKNINAYLLQSDQGSSVNIFQGNISP